MHVIVNGKTKEIDGQTKTIADLLAELELNGKRTAVEQNGTILQKEDWESQPVQDGDQLEVVHFVGGG
ncbi:sulfur carrier protein ThiS [Alkalicoccus luteus]|uniref:Sulfur carrier protein ThiS n=1 Tax=Alkalicoccus luteus TaxID=1237094 RepID=A0A969TTW1_9BACI|nr:sulfur carrier protein ThiS [Alkalicoccus luteus]NJP38078.1 sulfur carrier protein ThiS [Alkalicoccus luteus]